MGQLQDSVFRCATVWDLGRRSELHLVDGTEGRTMTRREKQIEALDKVIGMIEAKQHIALLADLPSHIHGYINTAKSEIYRAIKLLEQE